MYKYLLENMQTKIKIIIADDHPVYIQGLVSVLQKVNDIELLGQASDGNMAVNLIRKYKPDVAVLDIQMPEPDGFQIAQQVIAEGLQTHIVFLTMFKEEALIKKVFDIGVKGYVLKENAITDIVQAIRAVGADGTYISPQIAEIYQRIIAKPEPEQKELLTFTEQRILNLIAEEKSSRQIAEELFISVKTVENHRGNICKKLGITGNSALIRYALKNKRNS